MSQSNTIPLGQEMECAYCQCIEIPLNFVNYAYNCSNCSKSNSAFDAMNRALKTLAIQQQNPMPTTTNSTPQATNAPTLTTQAIAECIKCKHRELPLLTRASKSTGNHIYNCGNCNHVNDYVKGQVRATKGQNSQAPQLINVPVAMPADPLKWLKNKVSKQKEKQVKVKATPVISNRPKCINCTKEMSDYLDVCYSKNASTRAHCADCRQKLKLV